MDLSRHVLTDLQDATRLYERKLCSLGVLRLKLERGARALDLDRPALAAAISALAERCAELEADAAPWLRGMELVDAVRAVVADPPSEGSPRLALVPNEPEPAESAAPESDGEAPASDAGDLPDDAAEPAMPAGVPRRRL